MKKAKAEDSDEEVRKEADKAIKKIKEKFLKKLKEAEKLFDKVKIKKEKALSAEDIARVDDSRLSLLIAE